MGGPEALDLGQPPIVSQNREGRRAEERRQKLSARALLAKLQEEVPRLRARSQEIGRAHV